MFIQYFFLFLCSPVNLVHDQGLVANADMGAQPQNHAWSANKAIDGNTNQSYLSNSCAITDWGGNRNTSIWWKIWLERPFNIGYLEIYFRADSTFFLLLFQKRFYNIID